MANNLLFILHFHICFILRDAQSYSYRCYYKQEHQGLEMFKIFAQGEKWYSQYSNQPV